MNLDSDPQTYVGRSLGTKYLAGAGSLHVQYRNKSRRGRLICFSQICHHFTPNRLHNEIHETSLFTDPSSLFKQDDYCSISCQKVKSLGETCLLLKNSFLSRRVYKLYFTSLRLEAMNKKESKLYFKCVTIVTRKIKKNPLELWLLY